MMVIQSMKHMVIKTQLVVQSEDLDSGYILDTTLTIGFKTSCLAFGYFVNDYVLTTLET